MNLLKLSSLLDYPRKKHTHFLIKQPLHAFSASLYFLSKRIPLENRYFLWTKPNI
jgi:hypothetical protein